jgi:hypothetical protein
MADVIFMQGRTQVSALLQILAGILQSSGRNPEAVEIGRLRLHLETEAMRISVLTDEGMKIPIVGKIVQQVFQQFRLQAAEREPALLMTMASVIHKF